MKASMEGHSKSGNLDEDANQASYNVGYKQSKLHSCKSQDEFIREYKKLSCRQAEGLYFQILTELKETISDGNIDKLKKLSNFFDCMYESEDITTLQNYDNTNNPFKTTNIVILACKLNKEKVVEYLLSSDINIINNLSLCINGTIILPSDKDEMNHNAFYYAIRSGNVELLNTLINKWPGSGVVDLKELDDIISQAYQELKLKNVPLSEEIEFLVQNKLLKTRFLSNASGPNQKVNDINNIRERIELVLHNINLLKEEYTIIKQVDDKFLFIVKFISRNIHVLKWQLKFTYDRLPWEEIEFCLVSFVFIYMKHEEINLICHTILSKGKILNYLEKFAKRLEENKKYILEDADVDKLATLPKLKREKVVMDNCPEFEELYNDYQQIRDFSSLKKINDWIKLASSVDPNKRDGQLTITRCLQVTGEYVKNTLESPKLSSTTSELLLLSLPSKTRQIVMDLHDSLSHTHSLLRRREIEQSMDINFFNCVQNDVKKIGNVINNILYSTCIKTIRLLLNKCINSKNLDETKEILEGLNNIEFKAVSEYFATREYDKLKELIADLNSTIPDKTQYEKELFQQINEITRDTENESKSIEEIMSGYLEGFALLKSLDIGLSNSLIDQNGIVGIKLFAKKILEKIPPQAKNHDLKNITEISHKIFSSACPRLESLLFEKVCYLIYNILNIAEFESHDIKWIEELREKLSKKGLLISKQKNSTEDNCGNLLELKISELKDILWNNNLSGKIENFESYKKNKKLQAVIEMLVMDILSILSSSKENNLENNMLFLDDDSPLLTGKCLRNHLAHDNALMAVLTSEPSLAVILNAKIISSESLIKSRNNIEQRMTNVAPSLKEKYDNGLITIINQEKMFTALEEGNLEYLQRYLKKGADIHGRSCNSWTALHFAAKGSSIETVAFVLQEHLDANVKDMSGQSPLHIAAAYGRSDIVKFLVRVVGLNVNDIDNCGKTSLHKAAQNGHKDTVEVLLNNGANTFTKDSNTISPLVYAIRNRHGDVAKIMLEKDTNIDSNETNGGFTPLHEAAEAGLLELVDFLLQNKANVNARTDKNFTPLHAAACNGYLEVVNILILNGGSVNAAAINGYTALLYAVELGHETVVKTLLDCGADVNAIYKAHKSTPLHYAAKLGYKEIVAMLLRHKANAKATTVADMTPLHLAAQDGHLEISITLLRYGADIHAKDKNNATPLYYAAVNGHKDLLKYLIRRGGEINTRANNNVTPLHIATLKGHKDITELLIVNEADVNSRDNMGRTPLHSAVMYLNDNDHQCQQISNVNNAVDIIELLIRNKADVNSKAHNGTTPLMLATRIGCENVIDVLMKNKAEVNAKNNHGYTPLHGAISGGHRDVVNILIRNEAEVNSGSVVAEPPLHTAVETGHKGIIEILLKNGANVNVIHEDRTPLFIAVKLNSKEIVEVLIENGAKVDEGDTLFLAVLAGYKDIVEIFLKNKASVNKKYSKNLTLLHLAAEKGHKKIVNALIRKRADVNAICTDNITPLHIASQAGHVEIVQILLENKAKVNAVSNEGTPIHLAARYGHRRVVEVLLKHNVKSDIKDKQNTTPLELAIANGHLQVAELLLQNNKVIMNAKSYDEESILHIALQKDNLQMVKYLVNEGCDINAKNASGLKPIHVAAREGYVDTLKFFLSKGQNVNELSSAGQTLLHLAAEKGQLEVLYHLIELGANVNSTDSKGSTPLHTAATSGYKDTIQVLLKNGAFYNTVDGLNRRPLDITHNVDIINLLESTDKLFEAVRRMSTSEVKSCIKAGAFVNAKNASDSSTPLHHAARKGVVEVAKVLLQNKANVNAVTSKGFTPLHYAAKFSNIKCVKALLANGAVYEAISNSGKTPSDVTADSNVKRDCLNSLVIHVNKLKEITFKF